MASRSLVDGLLLVAAQAHCRAVLNRLLRATRRATRVQEEILLQKIRRNQDSDYGRAHGFEQITGYRDFVRQVPLQTYDDMEPYIQRVRRGAFGALFGGGQRVRMFALTSGSAGRPKHIPVTDAFLKEFRAGWNAFGVKSLLDHPNNFLKPIVQVTSRMDESHSEAGIPCGAITGLMAASQKYLVRKYYVTPVCVANINDPLSRYYTIMRLSVPVERVAFMVTANPATPLRLAKTASDHAVPLIRDIHDGTLRPDLPIPEAVRQGLAGRLAPNPQRARQLQRLLDDRGALLPKDYWKMGFMCNWTGGTLGLFLRDFPRYFGDTPVRDIGLIASEGRMSIPLQDGTPTGVLEVTSSFYEFIPADQVDRSAPDCLRSHEVQVGSEYFIVLTNSAGLYRYCIGDRVRVVGFEGQAPLIEFLSKGAHISSMTGEKLTEHQVSAAVNHALLGSGLDVGSYVLAPRWADPPFYLLHLDGAAGLPAFRASGLATAIDRQLCSMNIEYASKRDSLRLGPPRINVLPGGYLESRDQRLSRRYRGNNEQFKHQFLLNLPGQDGEFPLSEHCGLGGLTASGKPPTVPGGGTTRSVRTAQ